MSHEEEELRSKLIEFLKLKADRNLLNNKIHDLAAQLAIMRLQKDHPSADFRYLGAGASGIDIQGYIHDNVEVACEVSTHDKYQGNRRSNIREDFERLEKHPAKHKYLAVVYEEVERSLKSNQALRSQYLSVQVIRVI